MLSHFSKDEIVELKKWMRINQDEQLATSLSTILLGMGSLLSA
jgi:hypothetical protein